MKAILVAAGFLLAVSAVTFALPAAGAQPQAPQLAAFCSSVTTHNCNYMLCIGDSQNQYGYYQCQYPIYWPCQYCVPLGPLE
jgi:hypothetical protein